MVYPIRFDIYFPSWTVLLSVLAGVVLLVVALVMYLRGK